MKPIFTLLFLSIVLYLQPSNVYAQPTVTGYTVCQGQPVPAGQGLTATVGGSTAPSTLTGALLASGPTYTHGSGNLQTSYGAGNTTYYVTFTVVAPVSGSYAIPMLSSYDNYMTLYANSFNPASPTTNFLYGDDDSYGAAQALITWNFQAGQTYVFVAASYSSGVTGAFSIPLPWTSGNVVEWFTSAVGGTVLGTGGIFNPVGVPGSGITNTNTASATTFYAGNQGSPLRNSGVFTISAAPITTNYAVCQGATIPAGQGMTATATGTIEWYTAAVGGSPIATGATLNPVGVPGSGITNTNTIANTTFYTQVQGSTCRVPVTFSVSPVLTGTVAYTICQGLTVPAGQGLGAIGGGSSAPTTLSGTLATSSPTYVRGSGNQVTSYSAGSSVYYQSFTFLCPVSGNFAIPMLSSFDNWMGLYSGPFNPASPATNFVFGDDDSYGAAQAVINYNFVAGNTYTLVASSYGTGTTGAFTIPLPFTPGLPVVWYANATGGSIIGTGTPFNPVGVVGSPLANTNTIGATTFYATLQGTDCRVPAVFTVSPGVAVTPYTVCQGQTVPAGQGVTGVSAGGTTQWYTVPTGGTIITTGTVMNPVGLAGSGITNTNTPGVTTFYASNSASTGCRIPVTFTIEATPTTTNYNICQSQTVPAGQGMTATIGGSTTPTTLSGSLTAASPTYVRGSGNSVTSYSSSGTTVRYQTFTFVAPVSGSFTIPMLSSFDNWMGMYVNSFNPASPATNFVYGDDDSYGSLQARILYTFTAGTTYVLVASSYGSGVSGTFTIPLPFTSAYVTQWFTTSTGGTAFATGGTVNPVGLAGSGIATTNVPGISTFYVGYQGNTCRVPVTFSINAATNINISASGSTAICAGSNVVLSVPPGAGYSYQWQQNSSNIAGATNASYTATAAGNYNIVVSAVGLCAIPASPAVVTVNPVPPATATITTPNPVCEGNTVGVAANTGTNLTYQWMRNNQTISGATAATYSATTSGNYAIVVTNSFNCSTTSSAAAVNIIPAPNSVITYTTTLNFCEGEAVVLNAYTAAGLSYQWFKNGDTILGATSSNYIATTGGSYSLNITNSTGCKGASQSLTVAVNPLPTPVITKTNFTLTTGTYQSYQWYYTSQPINGANGQSFTFTQDGFYNVAVTDVNGCRGLSQTIYASNTTGIATVPGGADIKVYPNPAHDIVNIESPRAVNVMVRDLAGRNVIVENDAKHINIEGIANGTYMLYITNTEGQLMKVEKLQKTQ